MAKKQCGGKLLPLPFTTFGEAAALGFEASVYCSRCYEHRSIDPAADGKAVAWRIHEPSWRPGMATLNAVDPGGQTQGH